VTDIHLIPENIPCPNCNLGYNTWDLLKYFIIDNESKIQCINCKVIFGKDYVAKFLGRIKDVDIGPES